jgi:hypothetical protein
LLEECALQAKAMCMSMCGRAGVTRRNVHAEARLAAGCRITVSVTSSASSIGSATNPTCSRPSPMPASDPGRSCCAKRSVLSDACGRRRGGSERRSARRPGPRR